MKESPSSELLKQNTIETDIKMDTAENCRRKYNSLKEDQKLHKLNDINYRLEILKKKFYIDGVNMQMKLLFQISSI